ncbi:hypothetical protein AB0283_10035 [Micromonospora vinacea]|uniref:hypothetical protein n=1 Tax=Micromonospora vinacea TaxID=709878 RepID=UPI00344CBF42
MEEGKDREAAPETVPGLASEALEELLVVESRHVETSEVGVVSAPRSEAGGHRLGDVHAMPGRREYAAHACLTSPHGSKPFHRLTLRVPLSTIGIAVAVGMCLAALGVALAARLWVFAGCLGAFLLLDSFFSVYIRVVRARRMPLENYAATVGLFGMLLIVPMPLAGLTLAAVGNLVDPAVLISGSAAAVFIGAVLTLPRGRALPDWPQPVRSGVSARLPDAPYQ